MILSMASIPDPALATIKQESLDSAARCPVFYDALHEAAHTESMRRLNAKAKKCGLPTIPCGADVPLPILTGNALDHAAVEALICRESFDLMATAGFETCSEAADFFHRILYTLHGWLKSTTKTQ